MVTAAPPKPKDKMRLVKEKLRTNFGLFCEQVAFIEDKENLEAIRFRRYDCQKEISDHLVDGRWVILLKARQLGMTWLLAVYCTWCLVTKPMFEACVIQQNKDYAKDFLRRVRFIYAHLPKWMKVKMKSDSMYELIFKHGEGIESRLRVIAGGEAAGRSLTANLIVFDEHAYIAEAKASRAGCEPTMEKSKGQIVVISTSAGPYGDFFELWQDSPQSGYLPIFFDWSEQPDRDEEWYEKEAGRHASNPMFMAREYPANATEAFLFAEGRCFPAFHEDRHARTLEELGLELDDAKLYRGIDYGDVAAYACLWIAHFPDSQPCFTVDPSCVNTIREMTGYHFDEKFALKERPVKTDDHTCFIGGTMIETLDGPTPIEIIERGQFVRTHLGWSLVQVGATPTGKGPVVKVTLDDDRKVTCTPDHPFALASGGWIRADEAAGSNVMVLAGGDHAVREEAMRERRQSRMDIPDEPQTAKELVEETKKKPPPGPAFLELMTATQKRKLPPIGFEAIEVKSVEAVGHGYTVYALQTEHGTYLANGILVSNCDALRYAVVQYELTGHVHVFKELFIKNSIAQGRTDLHDIADIHEMSGWIEAPEWQKETYKPGPQALFFESTVTDSSRPKITDLYCQQQIMAEPYERGKKTSRENDVLEGIGQVNLLIDGTKDVRKRVILTPQQQRERLVRRRYKGRLDPREAAASLEEAALREVAREGVRASEKRREGRSVVRRYRPYGRGRVRG